jgi:hypothetical protein
MPLLGTSPSAILDAALDTAGEISHLWRPDVSHSCYWSP